MFESADFPDSTSKVSCWNNASDLLLDKQMSKPLHPELFVFLSTVCEKCRILTEMFLWERFSFSDFTVKNVTEGFLLFQENSQ